MVDILSLVLLGIFTMLCVYLAYIYFANRKHLKIKDKSQMTVKVLVIVLLALVTGSLILNYKENNPIDYLRSFILYAVVFFFYNMHDGVGDDGVVAYSRFYAWNDINAYDYAEDAKQTTLFIETPGRKGDEIKRVMFTHENGAEAIKIVKDNIPKKYKRMKKTT